MPADNYKPYSGKMEEIPVSLSKINNSLTIPRLQSILKFNGLPITGTKDQLVMRVYLLRCNKMAARKSSTLLAWFMRWFWNKDNSVWQLTFIEWESIVCKGSVHTSYLSHRTLTQKKTSRTSSSLYWITFWHKKKRAAWSIISIQV